MLIIVDRFTSDSDATLSRIFVDQKFICFGLEDEYREQKKTGETRIPSGTYNIGIRNIGGFHKRYSKKFPDIHKGMLQIMNVPNFEYILIHIGNTDKHTDGCLLVGLQAIATIGEMRVNQSCDAYELLYPLVIDAALKNELKIEFQDNDL